ncbi:MAG: hypothetical protein ACD_3C00188G0027 [uncultured bacterium (gcode 4)]|uniref:Uncharacterized protein n=1 Tax=uncultured bacterium (gcode 4) TaxID=1234023 RepID=K2F914_9BACT|nr:MAG: hypothetical protein ACD_3C00188G0027 [uncultured bacterium (gcode 4)]
MWADIKTDIPASSFSDKNWGGLFFWAISKAKEKIYSVLDKLNLKHSPIIIYENNNRESPESKKISRLSSLISERKELIEEIFSQKANLARIDSEKDEKGIYSTLQGAEIISKIKKDIGILHTRLSAINEKLNTDAYYINNRGAFPWNKQTVIDIYANVESTNQFADIQVKCEVTEVAIHPDASFQSLNPIKPENYDSEVQESKFKLAWDMDILESFIDRSERNSQIAQKLKKWNIKLWNYKKRKAAFERKLREYRWRILLFKKQLEEKKEELSSLTENAGIAQEAENLADKLENEEIGRIRKMNGRDKKSFSDGLSEIGFKTSELKNKVMWSLFSMVKDISKKDWMIGSFFWKWSELHIEEKERLKAAKEKAQKSASEKFTWIWHWAMNMMKFWRIAYDAIDTVSFWTINPFRNITAISMFAWRCIQVAKETRLDNAEVKENTRIEESRAHDEAWRIYKTALKQKWEWALTKKDLEKAYMQNLHKDIKSRLDNADFMESWFLQKLLQEDARQYIDWIRRKMSIIQSDQRLSQNQRQEKMRLLMIKNDELLRDLDRMVSTHWTIDALSYWWRVLEKTSKWVASLLVIDSVWRLASTAWDHFSLFKWFYDSLGIDFKKFGFAESIIIDEASESKSKDTVIGKEPVSEQYENYMKGSDFKQPLTDQLLEVVETKKIDLSLNANLIKDMTGIRIPENLQVNIREGDSIWRTLKRVLPKNEMDVSNDSVNKIIQAISKNPEKFDLHVDNINVVSIDDLKKMNWVKVLNERLSL